MQNRQRLDAQTRSISWLVFRATRIIVPWPNFEIASRLPHIAGESLRARLTHERELPVGEAVRILRDVCDALAYAHSHGIVHRDVKPDNVLFSGRHALVTDFGVAKAVADSTGTGALT